MFSKNLLGKDVKLKCSDLERYPRLFEILIRIRFQNYAAKSDLDPKQTVFWVHNNGNGNTV
jgi:hypothetical protein